MGGLKWAVVHPSTLGGGMAPSVRPDLRARRCGSAGMLAKPA